jgi:large subunit ribosomal protein L15
MSAYEGGQMRLLRRLPKVGFNSKWPTEYQIVHTESLNCFNDGTSVNPASLKDQKLIKTLQRPVKILNKGPVNKKLSVSAHQFSKTASEAISKAGGKVQVIGKE